VVTLLVRVEARIARPKERLAVTPGGKLLLVDPTRRVVVPMPRLRLSIRWWPPVQNRPGGSW
jgi:hypothetical protein